MLKEATLWYRWCRNDKGEWFWDFNHLEDGHCPNDHPTSKQPIHDRVWAGGKWEKTFVYLNENNVVKHQSIP